MKKLAALSVSVFAIVGLFFMVSSFVGSIEVAETIPPDPKVIAIPTM